MRLIIAEKPSVAFSIAKALGVKGKNDRYIENDKYIITWCIGNELAEALKKLPEHKRNVLLLSYFVGMSDKEIGGCLGAIQQTIFKRRLSSLRQLKELLEKEGFEWLNN